MRIALFESIMTSGGHEIEFDRMCVEELRALGNDVFFYVPAGHKFQMDYGVPAYSLPGEGVSYQGVGKLAKLWYSAKREINRVRWFNALGRLAGQDAFDLLIVPTASFRFLRSAAMSGLKRSPKPVILIVHGVTDRDAANFFRQAEKLAGYPAIKIAVLTPEDSVFGRRYPNVFCLNPPTYIPRDIPDWKETFDKPAGSRLRLGFFGQYRREKNLGALLDMFVAAGFPAWVELFVQGATVDPADTADFQRLQQQHRANPQITFLHKALVGREWQEAILGVDALILPYSADRFLYQPSAMLYTAIGYRKPVVVADNMSPALFARYKIGVQFTNGDGSALKEALRRFVDTYREMQPIYGQELRRVNADCGPARLAGGLVRLAGK